MPVEQKLNTPVEQKVEQKVEQFVSPEELKAFAMTFDSIEICGMNVRTFHGDFSSIFPVETGLRGRPLVQI